MRKLLAALLAVLLCFSLGTPAHAWLAQVAATGGGSNIAFDSAQDPGGNGGSGTLTKTVVAPSLTNGLMVVCVAGDTSGNSLPVATYNGSSMSAAVAAFQNTGSGGRWLYFFYLLSPASGSHTLQITQTGGGFLIPVVGFYSGVIQTSPVDATANGQGNTPLTQAITVGSAGAWPIACTQDGNNTSFTSGTNATVRVQDASFHNIGLYDSAGPVSTGSYSMTFNATGSTIGVSIASFKKF